MKSKILFSIVMLMIIRGVIGQNACNDKQSVAYGGLIYKIKVIGNQCWMAENLNIGKMTEGKHKQTDNNEIEKYCYDDEEENCMVYGGLYQWDEMMQYVKSEKSKGICPDGWHVASDNDWCILERQLGMTKEMTEKQGGRGTTEGGRLLKKGGTGFEAMLSGNRMGDGNFYEMNVAGYFWTSSQDINNEKGITRYLMMESKQIYRELQDKEKGFAVRCVKD